MIASSATYRWDTFEALRSQNYSIKKNKKNKQKKKHVTYTQLVHFLLSSYSEECK